MATATRVPQVPEAPSMSARMRWTVTDSLLMARRNLLRMARRFDYIVFLAIQPVMFILLFNFVFGGAISTGTANYIDFLIPGVMVQTVMFTAMNTGTGLAEDLTQGMVDRYRSLPMSRAAVVAGRITADLAAILMVIVVMLVVGFAVGFRLHGNILESIGVPVFTLVAAIPYLWISALLGVWIRNVETMQSAGFIWLFPLTFVSSAFVPVESMHSFVQGFAEQNPVTIAVNTVRGLALGTPDGGDIVKMLIWTAGLTVVFSIAAVNRYRRM